MTTVSAAETGFALHPQLINDCLFVADLSLCRLLLMNDQQYPWCILVPRRSGVKEAYELDAGDQSQLHTESMQLCQVMMELFRGEKMNVAALGNVVPQLHVHHIVRYATDPCWPKPVWGQLPARAYRDADAQQRVQALKAAFKV